MKNIFLLCLMAFTLMAAQPTTAEPREPDHTVLVGEIDFDAVDVVSAEVLTETQELTQNLYNMGNFRIVIDAIGGHGVDRDVKNGEKVNHFAEGMQTPDAMAKQMVNYLQANGIEPESAKLIHWPDQTDEVTDDLITGIRTGNF